MRLDKVVHPLLKVLLAILIASFSTPAPDSACLLPHQQRPDGEEAQQWQQHMSNRGTSCVREPQRTTLGSSLLQLASKPSKVPFDSRSVTKAPTNQTHKLVSVNLSHNHPGIGTNVSGHQASLVSLPKHYLNVSALTITNGPVDDAAGSTHGLARTTASFLQAILHAQHSLGAVSTSGGFYVLTVMSVGFCALGLLGYLHSQSQSPGKLEDADMRQPDFASNRSSRGGRSAMSGPSPSFGHKSPQASAAHMKAPLYSNDAWGSAAPSRVNLQSSNVYLRMPNLLPTPETTSLSLPPASTAYAPAAAMYPPQRSQPQLLSASPPAPAPPVAPSSPRPASAPPAAPSSPKPAPVSSNDVDCNNIFTRQLCPGLVVPRNSECVLALRALPRVKGGSWAPSSPSRSSLRVDILDLAGQPVLRAQVQRPWPVDRAPVVKLSTRNGEKEEHLALARAGGNSGQRRSTYIYDCNDVLFGFLKRDVTRPRYVLTSSRGGLNLLFEGNFDMHEVDVFSERRDMFAHTEPCVLPTDPEGNWYQVRIAENVDVGLIMSGLLAIDAMEHDKLIQA